LRIVFLSVILGNVNDQIMQSLAYRVTPIPMTLRDFVFDFGSLEPAQEEMYVQAMVSEQLKFPESRGND
jgi:hypothetical protein